MIDTQSTTYKKPKSDTCHCSDPKPGGACCDLVCFERPNYFCGHLLTDTDLSKEQQYTIEKHKLYNRALHGWGVVCGLRLTCDSQCGGIIIDDGYAIDDCGNDLVVCDPLPFDVIARLKEKRYVVGNAAYDPCKPDSEQPKCEFSQCFYVTICYDEEPREFTTPFVAGCRPSLTECEPTRIREGVRFDVLNELPAQTGWLEDLKSRLEGCFCLFSKGAFADALQTNNATLAAITKPQGEISSNNHNQYYTLFCELRGLLLLFLKKYPDKYNCKLDYEIRNTILPDPKQGVVDYGKNVRNAFCDLLRLAWQYAISCALGELIPRCPGPKHAGCVVLGTVEVKGDCVTHVCNCPRSYVWSFANFWQVLIATMFDGVACEEETEAATARQPMVGAVGTPGRKPYDDDCEEKPRHVCCAEFDIDCEFLVTLLGINSRSLNYAGAETVRAFSDMARSVKEAFNFAKPRNFSSQIFQHKDSGQLDHIFKTLGVRGVVERAPLEPKFVHPAEMLYRTGLARPKQSAIVAQHDADGVVVNAYAVPRDLASRTEQAASMEDLKSATRRMQDIERHLNTLIETAEARIKDMSGTTDPKLADMRKKMHEELTRGSEQREGEGQKSARKRPSSRRKGPQSKEGGENG